MKPYRVVSESRVFHYFHTLTKRDRLHVLDIFDCLAAAPHQEGDDFLRDESGRRFERKRFGLWTVTYWVDGAVREVRVVDLARAPRVRRKSI
jgi:hypothetical protein